MIAKYPGKCRFASCRMPIYPGQQIELIGRTWLHSNCAATKAARILRAAEVKELNELIKTTITAGVEGACSDCGCSTGECEC